MIKAVDAMYEKARNFSDRDILTIWDALSGVVDLSRWWDEQNGITMEMWAEAIYHEKSLRHI